MASVMGLFFAFMATGAFARVEENSCVRDVVGAIDKISANSRSELALWTDGQVPEPFYTQSPFAFFGIDDHFQGFTRLRNSKYMVISGANYWLSQPQLFVVEMGSRSEDSDFGSNLSGSIERIPVQDRIVRRFDFEPGEFWHVGGIASVGHLLVVPLEDGEPAWRHNEKHFSRIVFLDMSNPLEPVEMAQEISRPHSNSGSVAMERLRDGRFVVAVSDDKEIDIYYSRTSRLEDGFDQGSGIRAETAAGNKIAGQAVQLLRQCDGRLFFLSFENTGRLPPLLNGRDVVTLSEIQGMTGSPVDRVFFTPVLSAEFTCDGWCNFSAAAGTYVGDDQKVRLYAAGFFRNRMGTEIRFAEFSE